MNYYIDFDHTLYNPKSLTYDMLSKIASQISKEKNLNFENIFEECKSMFNRKNIYNIYKLCDYFAQKYSVNSALLKEEVNTAIQNGEKNVFEDSIPFLKNLKENNHKIYLLSYYEYGLEYQTAKILGSKLTNYFDGLFITGTLKYNLDIDYTNGIFIDDKPDDLLGLYSKNPIEVIRIRRKKEKYSDKELNNLHIKDYELLTDITV